MKTDRFIEILEDKSLAEDLLKKETPEEVKDFLNENGFECSIDEVNKIGSYMASALGNRRDGELSEKELSEVAGGDDDYILPEGWMRLDDALGRAGMITYQELKDFFSKW